MLRYFFSLIFLLFNITSIFSQQDNSSLRIALLKYNGGGDWYSNPTSLPNLIKFCNSELKTNINLLYNNVEVGSTDLFNYPFVHMTGHGNVFFTSQEVENLRKFLTGGGFLHIDDNYGMDEFVRREMKKVFPDLEFELLPASHPIFHQKYDFPKGIPKIHEHDNKPAQAFAIFYEGRIVCLYTYECDLGDGWEDIDVHHDSQETRLKALKMGANIISYVFDN